MHCMYVNKLYTIILESRPYGHKYWNPFLPVDESHTHTLSRATMQALKTTWPDQFLQVAFSNAVKPQGSISWPVWPLRGINKTAWSAKLILMADLAYPVSCSSLGDLLTAQHRCLSLNVCFNPPAVPLAPIPPTPPLSGICYFGERNRTESLILQTPILQNASKWAKTVIVYYVCMHIYIRIRDVRRYIYKGSSTCIYFVLWSSSALKILTEFFYCCIESNW